MATLSKQNTNKRKTSIRSLLVFAAALLSVASPQKAQAQEETNPAASEAEKLRQEIGSQIQLLATNLIDEMVYSWIAAPPFEVDTPVVLAGVSVPLGMGSGLTTFLENHYFQLIAKNPRTRIKSVYCPACTSLIVHAKPEGTLLARGIDNPEILTKTGLAAGAKYALHLDFEAEGASLVLRAYLTSLSPDLPIVWAKSISSAATAGALLRSPTQLMSASEAREEYLRRLENRDRFEFPIRAIYRDYKSYEYYYSYNNNGASPITAPYLWFELGAEMSFTQARVWGGGINVGFTTLHQTHEGFSVGARFNRLISGSTRSLVRPDLFLFVGATLMSIKGVNAANFVKNPLPTSELLSRASGNYPKATFGCFKLGLETRIKNRFGAGLFLETIPTLADSGHFGEYADFGIVSFPSYGVEVGLWF